MIVDLSEFVGAFGRDVDCPTPATTWLDRDTGHILWIYLDKHAADKGITIEDNREDRKRIENSPERYLEVPGRTHGDHHDILKKYIQLVENETGDTVGDYFGSIGRWKKTVSSNHWESYLIFRNDEIEKMARDWLRKNKFDLSLFEVTTRPVLS